MPDRFKPANPVAMPFSTWAEYRQAHNIDDTLPTPEIERHRQIFRREYQKAYGRKRRQEKQRLSTEWSKFEYRKLKRFAKRYRQPSLNQFIKQCVLAYLEDEYVEHDPVLAKELKQQIRAIGNNINQVIHALHMSRDYTNRVYYDHVKVQVDVLQQLVHDHRQQPPKLREQLEKLFAQVPESINDFQRFLDIMKDKYAGDDH